MKELSVEQKAKAYDEALKVLHKYDGANIMFSQDLKEEMFPELKESNDERMWKLIKKYAHCNVSDMALNADHITREQLESWLEKQGEKGTKRNNGEIPNSAWSEEDENYYQGCLKAMKTYGGNDTPISKWIESLKDRVQPQLKQEWSEEDESYLNTTIAYLKDAKEFKKTAENCINWLKSLRPQSKKEWNKEDEKMLKTTTSDVLRTRQKCGIGTDEWDIRSKALIWLKSLKDRYTWKPSEEQLEALDSATENCAYSEYQDCLRELIEQLKKLKEE